MLPSMLWAILDTGMHRMRRQHSSSLPPPDLYHPILSYNGTLGSKIFPLVLLNSSGSQIGVGPGPGGA